MKILKGFYENQDHKPNERGYGYHENFKGRLIDKTSCQTDHNHFMGCNIV